MIVDKHIKVNVNGANRKYYEKILSKELKNGELISVNQFDIPSGSRIEVECECDLCEEIFPRKRSHIKGNTTLCSRTCRNEFLRLNNPNPKKEMVDVECLICKEKFEVFPSKYEKQDNFMCSWDCYKTHRSENLNGEKIYNYQDISIPCETCGEKVKTSKWYLENKRHQFCSQECYWEHRREFYVEFYYQDNLNNSRKETNPERLVREWLQENNIKFKQECGFLRKYFVDFYLPDQKIIIEVYGDYWHVNPEIYDIHMNNSDKIPLNDYQMDLINSRYDEIRKQELESYGYPVFILWEKDILYDLNKAITKIECLSETSNLSNY